jgi:hypothetical protein
VRGFTTGGTATYIIDLNSKTYNYIGGYAKYLSNGLFSSQQKWYFDIGGYVYVDTLHDKDGNLIKFLNEANPSLKCTPKEEAQVNFKKQKCVTVKDLLGEGEVDSHFLQSLDTKIEYIVD